MKKFLLALAVMIMSTATCAAQGDMTLPPPNTSDKLSVMAALNQRHSSRNFVDKDLTPAQMSKILWAANGINRPDGKRVNPAGKGVYCVEVYAVTREGIYLYEPENHKLKLMVKRHPLKPPSIWFTSKRQLFGQTWKKFLNVIGKPSMLILWSEQ